MRPFIFFLTKNPQLNRILLLGYFLLVVLPHEFIGVHISKLFKDYSRTFYNNTISILFLFGSMLVLVALTKQLIKLNKKVGPIIYLVINFGLMAASFYYLIIVNIECIHFIQYGLFALLAFPIFRHFLDIILMGLMAATLDEAYQYFYLSPQRTNYFDFNDLVLDLIGLGMGIIILYIYNYRSKKKGIIRLTTILFSIFCILIGGLFVFDFLWINPTESSVDLWTIIRIPEEGFWTFLNFDVVYHVLKPWEGLIILSLLSLFYWSIELQKTN